MSDIAKVDKNVCVDTTINKSDIRFLDVKEAPFTVHGVTFENGLFRRMPESVAKTVSNSVEILNKNTTGGKVRFQTDSPYVAIHAEMEYMCNISVMAFTGSAGFDLYVRENGEERYVKTFVPPEGATNGYESVIELGTSQLREFTIHFPLYSAVKALYVGVRNDATVCKPHPFTVTTPIVFYGSSITHGGCATRPGAAYTAIVARHFDADHINLGFPGSALAEQEIADYIKGLNMSVFIYDYDHNAPSTEHLANTHSRMFKTIRAAQPTLPIVILNRPKYQLNDEEQQRLKIIRSTYEEAKQNGDEHVYFIDNRQLTQLCKDEGVVDGTHPSDLGFMSMAQAVIDTLKTIL